jgi:hypothetical protein
MWSVQGPEVLVRRLPSAAAARCRVPQNPHRQARPFTAGSRLRLRPRHGRPRGPAHSIRIGCSPICRPCASSRYRKRAVGQFRDQSSTFPSSLPGPVAPASSCSISVSSSVNTSRRARGPQACSSRAKSAAALLIRSVRPTEPCWAPKSSVAAYTPVGATSAAAAVVDNVGEHRYRDMVLSPWRDGEFRVDGWGCWPAREVSSHDSYF